QSLDGLGGNVLRARQLLHSDTLLFLPPPTTASGVPAVFPGPNGQTFSSPQHVSVTVGKGDAVTFAPGIYGSITISGEGPGTVIFHPGIYVLLGGQGDPAYALRLETGAAVTGEGVLFYNTGSNYDWGTGLPDADDGNARGGD